MVFTTLEAIVDCSLTEIFLMICKNIKTAFLRNDLLSKLGVIEMINKVKDND